MTRMPWVVSEKTSECTRPATRPSAEIRTSGYTLRPSIQMTAVSKLARWQHRRRWLRLWPRHRRSTTLPTPTRPTTHRWKRTRRRCLRPDPARHDAVAVGVAARRTRSNPPAPPPCPSPSLNPMRRLRLRVEATSRCRRRHLYRPLRPSPPPQANLARAERPGRGQYPTRAMLRRRCPRRPMHPKGAAARPRPLPSRPARRRSRRPARRRRVARVPHPRETNLRRTDRRRSW